MGIVIYARRSTRSLWNSEKEEKCLSSCDYRAKLSTSKIRIFDRVPRMIGPNAAGFMVSQLDSTFLMDFLRPFASCWGAELFAPRFDLLFSHHRRRGGDATRRRRWRQLKPRVRLIKDK